MKHNLQIRLDILLVDLATWDFCLNRPMDETGQWGCQKEFDNCRQLSMGCRARLSESARLYCFVSYGALGNTSDHPIFNLQILIRSLFNFFGNSFFALAETWYTVGLSAPKKDLLCTGQAWPCPIKFRLVKKLILSILANFCDLNFFCIS